MTVFQKSYVMFPGCVMARFEAVCNKWPWEKKSMLKWCFQKSMTFQSFPSKTIIFTLFYHTAV